jgi:hypothetical protein
MSTLAVTTAHTFVLTVSHGLLFHQPLDYLCNGRFCRRFLSSFTALPVLRLKTPKNFPVSIFSLDPSYFGSKSSSRLRYKPNRRQQLAGRVQTSSRAITHAPNP